MESETKSVYQHFEDDFSSVKKQYRKKVTKLKRIKEEMVKT